MASTQTAKKTLSLPGVFAPPASIKTSIASSASPASYNGAALNGTIGATAVAIPRKITATLTSSAGSYTLTSITVTGTVNGVAGVTDTMAITSTAGGITISTSKYFTAVSQIDIPSQTNTSGAFTFGQGDALVNCGAFRVGTGGDVAVRFGDGTTDIVANLLSGEQAPLSVREVLMVGTTAKDFTAYLQ